MKSSEQSSERDLPSLVRKEGKQILNSVQPSLCLLSEAEAMRAEFSQPGEHFFSGGVESAGSAKLPYPSALLLSSWRAQIPVLNLLTLEPFPQLGQQVNPLKTNVTRILLEKKLLGKFNNTIMPPKYTVVPSLHCDKIMTISQCISPTVSYCYLPTDGYWSHRELLGKCHCTPYPRQRKCQLLTSPGNKSC